MRQFNAGDIYQCRTDKNGGKIVKTQVKLKKRHQEWLNKTNKLKPEQKKKNTTSKCKFSMTT